MAWIATAAAGIPQPAGLPPWLQDVQAWVALVAVLGLGAEVLIRLVINPSLDPSRRLNMPEWEEISAVAMAVHNMHLMACSLGLGCKWSSGATSRHPHVAQFLELHPPAQLLGFLYVGKPARDWPVGQRRPIAEKVKWMVS